MTFAPPPQNTLLVITPILPPGPPITLQLAGDSTLDRGGSSGSGGWQVVDRPRRQATIEWLDYSPLQLSLTAIIDWAALHPGQPLQSVEPTIAALAALEYPAPGTLQPPVLQLAGPVPATNHQWVLYSKSEKTALRDPVGGWRYQQMVDLVFWEFVPATISVLGTSPAAAAQQRQASSPNAAGSTAQRTTYTVKAGETLLSIAANQLGNVSLWTQIAQLNNLRDPTAVTAGQVIQLPVLS